MSTAFGAFPIVRSLAVTLSLLGVTLTTGPAHADRYREPEFGWGPARAVTGNLVSVEVRVDGHRSPLYRAPGVRDRRYFEAVHGESYALQLRNRTGERVGVLIAVDGLNVVNGERTSLSNHEPMYVLAPWQSTTIRGWRTSLQQVREFVFVDEDRSYANRTGQANDDMGWIRVLAFEEARPVAVAPPHELDRSRREKGGNAPESFPGTGWGDRRHDPVRETWFEPVEMAGDRITLRYEYAAGLAALGIFSPHDRLAEREFGGFARPPHW